MENVRLTWAQIATQYDCEWVQLVNYEWAEGEPFPSSGIVGITSFGSLHNCQAGSFSDFNNVQDPSIYNLIL